MSPVCGLSNLGAALAAPSSKFAAAAREPINQSTSFLVCCTCSRNNVRLKKETPQRRPAPWDCWPTSPSRLRSASCLPAFPPSIVTGVVSLRLCHSPRSLNAVLSLFMSLSATDYIVSDFRSTTLPLRPRSTLRLSHTPLPLPRLLFIPRCPPPFTPHHLGSSFLVPSTSPSHIQATISYNEAHEILQAAQAAQQERGPRR